MITLSNQYSVSGAQLLLAVLALSFILYHGYLIVKHITAPSLFRLLISTAIWIGILITALFPEFTRRAVRFAGLGENFNTLIFATFVIVFVLVYWIIHRQEVLRKDLTQMVRQLALRDFKAEYGKKRN